MSRRPRRARYAGRLLRSAAAEAAKLRTLPAAVAAALGTVGVSAALAGAVAAGDTGADAVSVVLRCVPFLQAGPVLIGVLAAGSEYAGGQVRTTLTATPDRTAVAAGKAAAFLAAAAAVSAVALAAGLAAAWLVADGGARPTGDGLRDVAGACGHLVLVGLFAHALAVLLRSVTAPLVAALGLLFIASPLLEGLTEHARWLPDQAGRLLYLPDADPVLGPVSGALVLAAWAAAASTAAVASLHLRDA
ncbi:hypothetical protein [Nocardiopsis trehalosi]|uniref:hypothetical protein n=1 Tax=Nocardiopsis trehalosi TaxID=109329 RepID=UPI00082EC6A9|nr:hypothetical protein [Nocardiopsis trehalosi]